MARKRRAVIPVLAVALVTVIAPATAGLISDTMSVTRGFEGKPVRTGQPWVV
jgi:hypothetical protein